IAETVIQRRQRRAPQLFGNAHGRQCHGPLHRYALQSLSRHFFRFPKDRRLTTLAPSRTIAAICERGMIFIWPYQRSIVSTNSSSALIRARATGLILLSPSASARINAL